MLHTFAGRRTTSARAAYLLNVIEQNAGKRNQVGCCCADTVHPPPPMPRWAATLKFVIPSVTYPDFSLCGINQAA